MDYLRTEGIRKKKHGENENFTIIGIEPLNFNNKCKIFGIGIYIFF